MQQLQALPLALTRMGDTQMLTAIAWRAGDPNPYLADQHGIIYHLFNGRSDPVLDLTAEVMDYQPGAEYGMLGMTFDPVDGRIILGFNGNGGDTRIASYAVGDNGRPDPASAREIPRIHKPGVGHNNGQLAFDADSNLFISMGDGGGSRGADAQDTTKLLGGLLRITPNRDGPGYTVPADNPYVGVAGVAPEIWAKGMRNPWRFPSTTRPATCGSATSASRTGRPSTRSPQGKGLRPGLARVRRLPRGALQRRRAATAQPCDARLRVSPHPSPGGDRRPRVPGQCDSGAPGRLRVHGHDRSHLGDGRRWRGRARPSRRAASRHPSVRIPTVNCGLSPNRTAPSSSGRRERRLPPARPAFHPPS